MRGMQAKTNARMQRREVPPLSLQKWLLSFRKLREDIRLQEGGSSDYRIAGGKCGVCSEEVEVILQEEGLNAHAYFAGAWVNDDHLCNDHAWVDIDGWILDVTADQFRIEGEDILLLSPKDPRQKRYRRWQDINVAFKEIRQFLLEAKKDNDYEAIQAELKEVKDVVFGEYYKDLYQKLVDEFAF